MVAVAAKPGAAPPSLPAAGRAPDKRRGQERAFAAGGGDGPAEGVVGMEALVSEVLALVPQQPRAVQAGFLMSVDHCFAVKGHGTVLTGTVLQVGSSSHRLLLFSVLASGDSVARLSPA